MLVLKELHDRLDAAVAAAYGWPADPSDAEILTRLVALNRERAAEEANGTIRWLRPAYQIPRFGTDADKPRLALRGGRMHTQETVQAGPKPPFPVPDNAQTAAVMAVLAAASAPMSADAIAARFKQGRRVLPKIGAVLASLARFAFVSTSNGGRSFSLRLAS